MRAKCSIVLSEIRDQFQFKMKSRLSSFLKSDLAKVIAGIHYIVALILLGLLEHKRLWGWNGLVVGNLLASAYWAPLGFVAWFHLHVSAIQRHKDMMEKIDDKSQTGASR